MSAHNAITYHSYTSHDVLRTQAVI